MQWLSLLSIKMHRPSLYHLLLIIISVSLSCDTQKSKWNKIKETSEVYPKDSIVVSTVSRDSIVTRKWVNKGYINYAYKKYCGKLGEGTFYLSDPKIRAYLFRDSLSVARFLQDEYKKEGVAHFVGQTLSEGELKVYIYYEGGLYPIQRFVDLNIQTSGTMKDDAEWKFYKSL